MNKKIRKTSLQSGYSVKKTLSSNSNKKIKYNKDELIKRYPNGIIPFIFITLFFAISLIVLMSVRPKYILDFTWQSILISISATTLCLDVLWIIGRTGLSSIARFGMMKFGRVTKFNKLKEKMNIYEVYQAIEDVGDYDSYKSYLLDRKKYTRKWCCVSMITHTIIFVISLIIFLIATYAF